MLSFFPQDVVDEILNLIVSVSEGFPTYSFIIYEQYEATSDGMQRIRVITPSAIFRNYFPLYYLIWKLCSLHNSETTQGIFMKLSSNLN